MNDYDVFMIFPVLVSVVYLFQNDIEGATFAMTCAIWVLVYERTLKINGKKL